ncbi:MBL fold metallo-hydrolase [Corynebacterium testudinoris]|uniref:Metal-dependent hydrolase, beta-lactamase superfamily III n=1 Tax=Corynebacterium testudinoris TaxID=136857 RepID=A0A0G3H9V7_9CORY|nr:MBL fold metallo-hydrolase [Corynebacterium testudinoris]AKK09565.1 metal-dependent hydrolase, beta-lactamase superfamily III [Corynebacterium testudinoris]
MKLTILGSSGSVGAPQNPASGYLVSVDNSPSVIIDMGPGVLAALQDVQDPSDAHVVFSHLHPDHSLDFPSLLVWRRFHPTDPARGRNLCFGPSTTESFFGPLSADPPVISDDMSDTFAFTPWTLGEEHLLGRVSITPFPAVHPVEAYSLRIREHSSGTVIAYSGDTGWNDQLIECARGADLFLCEATWSDREDDVPPDMHLSGLEAGRAARLAGVGKLMLVHMPPWADPFSALAAARREFDGPIEIGLPGMVIEF